MGGRRKRSRGLREKREKGKGRKKALIVADPVRFLSLVIQAFWQK